MKNCSDAWRATGGFSEMTAAEGPAREGARRSIVAATDIPAGKALEEADVDFKRPGTGLPPTSLDLVLGKRTVRSLQADELITPDVLAVEPGRWAFPTWSSGVSGSLPCLDRTSAR